MNWAIGSNSFFNQHKWKQRRPLATLHSWRASRCRFVLLLSAEMTLRAQGLNHMAALSQYANLHSLALPQITTFPTSIFCVKLHFSEIAPSVKLPHPLSVRFLSDVTPVSFNETGNGDITEKTTVSLCCFVGDYRRRDSMPLTTTATQITGYSKRSIQ